MGCISVERVSRSAQTFAETCAEPDGNSVAQCKVDAIKGYGGIITPCAPTMEARESTAAEVEQRTGASFIPPYNYGPTICGQGTIALEFLQQASHAECSETAMPDKILGGSPQMGGERLRTP